jgi:Ketopantoate reductase PanE/ApbA
VNIEKYNEIIYSEIQQLFYGEHQASSKMSTPTSYLLVGCGAVGSVCALTLERSKRAAVTVVARSNYDAVKEKGFMVKSIEFGEILGWKPSYGAVDNPKERQMASLTSKKSQSSVQ